MLNYHQISIVLGLLASLISFSGCGESNFPLNSNPPVIPQSQSENNEQDASSSQENNEKSNPTQDQFLPPAWQAHYQSPKTWLINPGDINKALLSGPQGKTGFLEMVYHGPINHNENLCQYAKSDLGNLGNCVPSDYEEAMGNCPKNRQIISTKIGNYEACLLRYNGTWMDRNQEVNVIYLNRLDNLMEIKLEGPLEYHRQELKKVLDTLEWRLESAPAYVENELELKGL